MGRTLCLWYPDWSLHRPDAPSDRPCQAIGDDHRVVAVNEAAAGAGIVVGMRRREAEAVVPTVLTLHADPGAEAAAFEPVASAVESIIPRVEVAAPGLLFAPVASAVRYYGGEAAVLARVAGEVARAGGPGFRIGLASGPFLARRAAGMAGAEEPCLLVEDDEAFLASLDVASLGSDDLAATFRWLGITTLGELARLPREAVVSRFGAVGLEAHRLAAGEDRSTSARVIPEDRWVEERFDPPLENLEQAGFVARSAAHALLDGLSGDGVAPHRVEIEVEAGDGTVRARTWRNADPFDEVTLTERVRWQLRAWLEGSRIESGMSGGIRGGLVRLRITPEDLSGAGRQLGLHEDPRSADEAYRALTRAQAIVGLDGVLMAHPQGGRDPGERVAWYRWGEPPAAAPRDPEAPWPGRIPGPAPALVPPEPRPLEVEWDGGMPARVRLGSRWEPVRSWAGPWRKVGRWWEGEGPADRFQIVTSAGAFLCEVREERTYLLGVYD